MPKPLIWSKQRFAKSRIVAAIDHARPSSHRADDGRRWSGTSPWPCAAVGFLRLNLRRHRWRSASPAPGTAARPASSQHFFNSSAGPCSGSGQGKVTGSLPPPALQIGMHHVALDRAGTHDRDLDDEIVEICAALAAAACSSAPGSPPGTRRANRPGTACRRPPASSRGIVASVPALAVMLLDQVEAFADAGQHAERQHVDLEDARARRCRPCPIR